MNDANTLIDPDRVRQALIAAFGEPVFVSDVVEAFDGWRVALRKDKPEVLMVIDELAPVFEKQFGGSGARLGARRIGPGDAAIRPGVSSGLPPQPSAATELWCSQDVRQKANVPISSSCRLKTKEFPQCVEPLPSRSSAF